MRELLNIKAATRWLPFIKNVFYILAGIQTLMFLYYTLCIERPGAGDECHFMIALDMVKQKGWSDAVRFGISIPHLIIVYPFSFLFPNYLALRLVNLMLIALFFRYIWSIQYREGILYAILLSYISTVSFYLFGTNDTLFIFGLAIFLIETYTYLAKGHMNYPILAFSSLLISFFTRQMVVFYIPIILVSLCLLYKNYVTVKNLTVPLLLMTLLVILNIPSLINENRLSYDNKKAPDGLAWPQIAYLSTIESNQHIRTEGDHPNWDEVRMYLKNHGEHSLPRTYGESIFYDLKLTLLEFPEDFVVALKGCIRQVGLLLFLPLLGYFYSTELSRKKFLYVITAFYGTLIIFSFVILAIVELRWIGAIALLMIITSFDMLRNLELRVRYRTITTFQLQSVIYTSYALLSLFGIITYSKLIL